MDFNIQYFCGWKDDIKLKISKLFLSKEFGIEDKMSAVVNNCPRCHNASQFIMSTLL